MRWVDDSTPTSIVVLPKEIPAAPSFIVLVFTSKPEVIVAQDQGESARQESQIRVHLCVSSSPHLGIATLPTTGHRLLSVAKFVVWYSHFRTIRRPLQLVPLTYIRRHCVRAIVHSTTCVCACFLEIPTSSFTG